MHPVTLVMVEDDEGHARLIEKNIRRAGINNGLASFRDGASALAYLFGPGGPAHATGAAVLILLDLNLPDMSGFDVLSELRAHSDPRVRRLPVVVLTTSRSDADVRRAYDLTASSFVSKPGELEDFLAMVATLREWWLERVELP